MSIKERKSRENTQLRQKILRAALKIFAEHGYRQISMRKIAALIDYSPTTIYRFFRNKEDLLGAIAVETYGDLAARFAKAGEEAGARPLERLKSVVREYILFCLERPEMFRLLSEVAEFEIKDGVIYERLGQNRNRVYQSWFGNIRRAVASGDLRVENEMKTFLFLWDAANGCIFNAVYFPGIPRKPFAEGVSAYLDLIFDGITKRND